MDAGSGGRGKPPPPTTDLRPPAPGLSEWGAPFLGLAFGGFLAGLALANIDREDPLAQQFIFAVQVLTPGLLALLARRRRPSLYLASGVVGMIVPFTALSGIAIPLIVPAGMSFVAYGRRAADERPRLAAPVLALAAMVLVMASWAALFIHQDPFCNTGPNFSDCGTDRITSIEADVGLAFSILAIVLPFFLSMPRIHEESR
jgi:hypothetical protein